MFFKGILENTKTKVYGKPIVIGTCVSYRQWEKMGLFVFEGCFYQENSWKNLRLMGGELLRGARRDLLPMEKNLISQNHICKATSASLNFGHRSWFYIKWFVTISPRNGAFGRFLHLIFTPGIQFVLILGRLYDGQTDCMNIAYCRLFSVN